MNLTLCLFWTIHSGIAPPAPASAPSKPTHPVAVTIWSDKPSYKVNEPIHLGIRVLNTSKRLVELDYMLDFHVNVQVIVTDQAGMNVTYPGYNLRIDGMPKQRLGEGNVFMKLWPGIFFAHRPIASPLPSPPRAAPGRIRWASRCGRRGSLRSSFCPNRRPRRVALGLGFRADEETFSSSPVRFG
jgi:hypothetical protein